MRRGAGRHGRNPEPRGNILEPPEHPAGPWASFLALARLTGLTACVSAVRPSDVTGNREGGGLSQFQLCDRLRVTEQPRNGKAGSGGAQSPSWRVHREDLRVSRAGPELRGEGSRSWGWNQNCRWRSEATGPGCLGRRIGIGRGKRASHDRRRSDVPRRRLATDHNKDQICRGFCLTFLCYFCYKTPMGLYT